MQGFVDQRSVGADDCGLNTLNGQGISRFGNDSFHIALGQEAQVILPDLLGRRVGMLAVLAMIDNGANWNFGGELRYAAGMILMKMSEEHEVDLGYACVFGCSYDAVSVAVIVAGPARIDQQGLA